MLELLSLMTGKGSGGSRTEGDASLLTTLFGLLEAPDPKFDIVTPRKAAVSAPRPRQEATGGD